MGKRGANWKKIRAFKIEINHKLVVIKLDENERIKNKDSLNDLQNIFSKQENQDEKQIHEENKIESDFESPFNTDIDEIFYNYFLIESQALSLTNSDDSLILDDFIFKYGACSSDNNNE